MVSRHLNVYANREDYHVPRIFTETGYGLREKSAGPGRRASKSAVSFLRDRRVSCRVRIAAGMARRCRFPGPRKCSLGSGADFESGRRGVGRDETITVRIGIYLFSFI